MSLKDRLKREIEQAKVAGKHPLLTMKAERNVRDAYFRGIVLAAYLDDNKVDKSERNYLAKLGVSMGLAEDDVADAVATTGKLDEDGQGELVDEISLAIDDASVAKLFLCEFTLIWASHASDWMNLKEYRSLFSQKLGGKVAASWFDNIDTAITDSAQRGRALAKISDFDGATLDYLFGNVADDVRKAKAAVTEEAKKKDAEQKEKSKLKELEDYFVDFIESDAEFQKRYDVASVISRCREFGIKDHIVTTLLGVLLPHAQKALGVLKSEIPDMEFSRDSNDSTVNVLEYESGIKFLNYLSLFDSMTTKDEIYSVCVFPQEPDEENSYLYSLRGLLSDLPDRMRVDKTHGHACLTMFWWAWRSGDGEREAKRAINELYDRVLKEFEYRAKF